MIIFLKQQNKIKFYASIYLWALTSSCAHVLQLSSQPAQVNVYSLNTNGTRRNQLGQTPLTLLGPQDNEDYYYLELEKAGFLPKLLIISQTHSMGSNSIVNVSLQPTNKEWYQTLTRGAFAGEANAVVSEFLELHTAMMEDSDAEIKKITDRMKEKYNKFSAFHSMLGAYYFSSKKLKEALTEYEKAIQIDPNNTDAVQMLRLLKTKK